jgi:phospholipase/carboxylesterase
MSDIDLLEHQLRPPRGEPEGALVMLHGRGVSELDLLPLLDELDPHRRLVGVAPRAPLELSPGGFHWYVAHQVGYPDPRTLHETYAKLGRWLAALSEELGVPSTQTVIGGFSQGAVMSYALTLGTGRPAPAGLLALSGFMPTVPDFELDLSDRQALPVAIGHGTLDPVISVSFSREARARLEAAGAIVLYRESPIGHGVEPSFIPTLRDWVSGAVSAHTNA